jgi:hypothetical protein
MCWDGHCLPFIPDRLIAIYGTLAGGAVLPVLALVAGW